MRLIRPSPYPNNRGMRKRGGYPKLCHDQNSSPGVQKGDGPLWHCDDHLRLPGRAVVGPREPGSPSHPWPDLGGWPEGDLGLMSPLHEGHGAVNIPNALLDGTLDIVEVVYKG